MLNSNAIGGGGQYVHLLLLNLLHFVGAIFGCKKLAAASSSASFGVQHNCLDHLQTLPSF